MSDLWRWAAMAAAAAGVFLVVYAGWAPTGAWLTGRWLGYAEWSNALLRATYSPLRARDFAYRHLASIVAGALVGVLWGSPFLAVVFAVIGGYLPIFWLERQLSERKKALEQQLDASLQSLANTILVTQNLDDAFATLAQHFDPPISQEADVLVKQVRLGTPMDEALRDLAARCKSRNMDAIVTALTVGRQTGGELPKVLETTASVLRETMRVEGVMESKTSEGKAQVVLMGALPFVFAGVLQIVAPEWMAPLYSDPVGWVVLSVACLLEFVGVMMVRKLSTIDV